MRICTVLRLFSNNAVPNRAALLHRSTSKRGESFGISRIGSKIKGVFKSTTMEGAMLPSYGVVEGEDDMVRAICREN